MAVAFDDAAAWRIQAVHSPASTSAGSAPPSSASTSTWAACCSVSSTARRPAPDSSAVT